MKNIIQRLCSSFKLKARCAFNSLVGRQRYSHRKEQGGGKIKNETIDADLTFSLTADVDTQQIEPESVQRLLAIDATTQLRSQFHAQRIQLILDQISSSLLSSGVAPNKEA